MSIKYLIGVLLSLFFVAESHSQIDTADRVFARIREEGFQHSRVMARVSQLTDGYGGRLTGSREYLAAAQWVAREMEESGLQQVHFEPFCPDCRGWSLKGFNLEMTSPYYTKISAYPLVMTKSTNGVVSGEVIHIKSIADIPDIKKQFTGKLSGKIILKGDAPAPQSLEEPLSKRFTTEELHKMQDKLTPANAPRNLPELLKSWEEEESQEEAFLRFAEDQGALAVLTTRSMQAGIIHPAGTYFNKKDQLQPLPYFTISVEHFGRLLRLLELGKSPQLRLDLDTEIYFEPQNNVNIIGELTGTDPRLKEQQILLGAHFDSWHAGTGATDNGVNGMVLIEALRILHDIGYQPRRTIRMGLWGGEEQAYYGSVAYAVHHFGPLQSAPNAVSRKVSAYLNLDTGAGVIRGVFLQANDNARPVFKELFRPLKGLTDGIISIENDYDTDHETFDHYGIPSFSLLQDPLAYESVTHHTNLDVLEYIPAEDTMKNAVIVASLVYALDQMQEMVPRKSH
ncbi:MAG: M28 family peptidase [Saprospiraceae bacterium]